MRLIFLAGFPATGKSHFGQWMAQNVGFTHVDIEKDSERIAAGISNEWDFLASSGNVEPLIAALKSLSPLVALDWGFPVQCMPYVEAFKADGAELWWFDADPDDARNEFLKRNTGSIIAFDNQVAAIKAEREAINRVFAGAFIDVLGRDGHG
jgi:hypothetical protein